MRRLIVFALAAALAASGALAGLAFAASSPTKPATVKTRHVSLGTILVDGKSRTLYLFEKDKHGKSACYGACAKVWAPYLTSGKPAAGQGLSSSKIGTTKRTGGATQVTYGGHPLYHYDDDKKPGQTEGEGSKEFGAEWYVVGANGKKIDND